MDLSFIMKIPIDTKMPQYVAIEAIQPSFVLDQAIAILLAKGRMYKSQT